MNEKLLILSGPDDVPVYKGSISELMLNRIKSQNKDSVLIIDQNTRNKFTAHDILTKSVLLATALKENGVKKSEVISIVSEDGLNYFIPVLAALYLGLTVSPINPIYSIGEMKHAFSLARPKIVFCSKIALSKVIQLKQETDFIEDVILFEGGTNEIADLDKILRQTQFDVDKFEVNDFPAENVAFILPSSGTTGLPKGVMISYNSIRYHLLYMELKPYLHMNSKGIMLGVVPSFHIFGLFIHLFAILTSMKIILISKFQPEVYLGAIEEFRVSKLFIVPQLAQFLAKSPLVNKFDLSSVNDVLCGGAPLSVQTLQDIEARLHIKLRQMYGMTECGAIMIDDFKQNRTKLGTTGSLVPHVKVKVRDVETGKLLGPNIQGEICIRGPTTTKGYIGNDQATKQVFDADGYLCTGDIGYYDKNGYFYIVDRLKDLIKYKGFQIAPIELESIILQHASVSEVAVVGIPNKRTGEIPLAIVVKKTGKEVTEQELMHLVAGQVSVLKHLHGGVKFTENLPKTSSGKVMKQKLRDKYKIHTSNL